MDNILAVAGALRARQISCVELITERLRLTAALDPQVKAFLTLTPAVALEAARVADAELAAGRDRGALHGIPIAHKDLFATRGIPTTAGSLIYRDWIPDFDAAVVSRLAAAGCISLGKLNLHELAYGVTSQNEHFGGVKNPWDLTRIPGGSSGGSGAAVALGLVLCGTGTDTGGSIRIPASYCGVAGIKPTYGRVSMFGCLPLAHSLDHMGPLARTVRDCALLLQAMAGHDPRDPTTVPMPGEDFLPPPGPFSLEGVRIGIPRNFYFDRADSEVIAAVDAMAQVARAAGATLLEVNVPDVRALNQATLTVQLPESTQSIDPRADRGHLLGQAVKPNVERGHTVTAIDYLNAKATIERFRGEFAMLFTACDVLFAPSTPITAPAIGAATVTIDGVEEDTRLATTRLMRGANALGLPAMSIPSGFSRAGMPMGLQIMGPVWSEARVLRVAAAVEDRTDFHLRKPTTDR
ncbi:MAG: Asp-tRNA(Asn)/Glu-tRNA(Gln) amidotransferase GatCAB subunit A [Bryobacteraceae bacterium]|nr:Asp-tRNA(Asn)/Glu-tRNA(Gln) amidotransferase GatCAB subunit A [Bryobacteraceae bacterium]